MNISEEKYIYFYYKTLVKRKRFLFQQKEYFIKQKIIFNNEENSMNVYNFEIF